MNKAKVSILLALGLLIVEVPEAAAHEESYSRYRSPTHYHDYRPVKQGRNSSMPRWLKKDRSFHHWYKHTRWQRNPYLSWYELHDIYRREYVRYGHRCDQGHKHYRH